MTLQFKVSSPCDQDWESMTGNDRIRFCSHCQKSVHHLSAMSRKEINRLVAKSKGQFCIRYSTSEPQEPSTPIKLYKIGRRVSRLAAGAFTASLGITNALAGSLPKQSPSSSIGDAPITVRLDKLVSSETGSIQGSVFDPNGALIPDATVTLVNLETRQIQSALSNAEGKYQFASIEVGNYDLKFDSMGFETNRVSMVTIQPNDDLRVDKTLSISPINEVVVVVAPPVTADEVQGGGVLLPPKEPLVRAANANDLDAVRAILITGDANVRDSVTGWTALESAIRNANREMVQVLLSSRADVNARDKSGQTVLMMLDEDVTADLVWDLLNAGAKVNARDNDGDTPLIEIASINNTEVLRVLIEAGAKVNAVNHLGQSALMRAAEEGLVNNVNFLIKSGADINQRDKKGHTALRYAKEGEHEAVERLLISLGAFDLETP